jgi:FkbM family methyltransferase
MLYNPADMYVGRSIDLYGEFSRGEVEMFDALVRPEHVVFDVGANIGAHTVWFAKRAKFCFAFEPQRLIFQMLCANVALNGLRNVQAFNAAVSDEAGVTRVPLLNPEMQNNFGALPAFGHDEGEPTMVMTLDEIDPPRVDFIKIDVEGHELQVLKGAQKIIKKFRPVLYVENDRKEKSEALIAFIREMNYSVDDHTPFLYSPDNFVGNKENVFGNIVSINVVCSPL